MFVVVLFWHFPWQCTFFFFFFWLCLWLWVKCRANMFGWKKFLSTFFLLLCFFLSFKWSRALYDKQITSLYPSIYPLVRILLLNPIWSLSPDLLFTKSDLRKDSKEKKKFHYVLKPEFLDFIVDAKIICYPALLPSQGLLRMNRRLVWSPTEDILMAQEYMYRKRIASYFK